jgi:hypothetical protein
VVAIAAASRKAHKAGEEQATMKEDLTGEVAEVGTTPTNYETDLIR